MIGHKIIIILIKLFPDTLSLNTISKICQQTLSTLTEYWLGANKKKRRRRVLQSCQLWKDLPLLILFTNNSMYTEDKRIKANIKRSMKDKRLSNRNKTYLESCSFQICLSIKCITKFWNFSSPSVGHLQYGTWIRSTQAKNQLTTFLICYWIQRFFRPKPQEII